MERIVNYTDGAYRKNNPEYHVSDSPWKASHILRILERNRVEANQIVEIGCGAGEILIQIRDHVGPGVALRGYDPNPDLADYWESRKEKAIEFSNADFLEMGEPADVVLCIDVFEHVPDYLGFLEKLRHRARYKVFHIPLDLSVQSVLRAKPLAQVRQSAGHIHYFTKETALASLEHAGYKVLDHFYTMTSVDRGKRLQTRIANIPRKLTYPWFPEFAVRVFGGYSLMVLAE